MATSAGKAGRGWRFWLKVGAPVAASMLSLVSLRLLGPDVVSQQQLSSWLRPLGDLAPLAFIGFLAIRPVTLLPGQLLTGVGGLVFGARMGSFYAIVGSLLASALIFVLAMKLGSRVMKRFAGQNYEAMVRTAKDHDFKFMALMTLNPLCPTDVVIAAAAASGARFWPTVLGVVVGSAPGTFLTAQFGSAVGQGKTILTLVSAAGLVLSLVLGVFVGRRMVKDFQRHSTAVRDEKPPRCAVAAGVVSAA